MACTAALRRTLDAVTDAPAWSMTTTEQAGALVELSRAQAQVAELRLRVLAAADHADLAKTDAATSTGAWLAHHTRQDRPRAHADVKLAQALDTGFAATRAALAQGRVDQAQARVIVHAVRDLPTDVTLGDRARAEQHLLELAADWDAAHLKGFGRKLLEVIAPDEAERRLGEKLAKQEREAARKTYLTLRDNGDGTSTGRFKIPTLHAQMLTKALHALTAPHRPGAPARTAPDGTKIAHPDLLGHGLCELIERYPANKLPKAGGLNATVVVTMTLEQLLDGLGAAGLDTGGEISAAQARRLACEAGLIPAVLGGKSQVLDLARKTRLHTESQRIAIGIRDKKCTALGCDRPPGWCHVHHPKPWSKGGRTSVHNGALLCPYHHHRAHDPAYDTTRLANGTYTFTRRT